MDIVVTNENIDAVFFELDCHTVFGFDTETSGLTPYNGHRLFSVIISTYKDNFYFNYNENSPEEALLPRKTLTRFRRLFNNVDNTFYAHNAKFDMHFMNVEEVGINWKANIICTLALARLVHNQLPSYSLAALGVLIGVPKDDTVEKYISKHKLYTLVDVGKAKPRKDKHFDQVPFDIMSKYGMQDGAVVLALGMYIDGRLKELAIEQDILGLPDLHQVVNTEIKLTKVLYSMEAKGIKIDKKYTYEAYCEARTRYIEAAENISELIGFDFQDGPKKLKEAFGVLGLSHGVTDKGNPSFTDDNLPDNLLGNKIREYRKAYKLANTYYKNLLDLGGENNVIHCDFRQSGTSTGRMSCSAPNLQNIPKRNEDTNPYPVRACFVPRKDYFYVMIDFSQMEYRLLLDLAGEKDIIAEIIGGLDVHDATGGAMGVSRTDAKTLNFMLLYGGGAQKLADALKCTLMEANKKKAKYFSTLTKVSAMVKALIKTGERRGYIVNPFGRRLLIESKDSYKAPNHYIQGGCGDIVKTAMVDIHELLIKKQSSMLLQIHDELVFEIHESERHLVPELTNLMRTAYLHKTLPMDADADYSLKNWHEKEEFTL